MTVIQQFRRLAFAQVLLGIVAFCVAAQNPGMLLAAGSLGALAWYVTEGPNGHALPRWLINLAAVLAVAAMVAELFYRSGQRPADAIVVMGYFTMWLQILLLYSEKTNREYAIVLVLSVLQMVVASALSVSIVYGLLLMTYCVLAMVTVLLFHFKITSDRVLTLNRLAAPEAKVVNRPRPIFGQGHRTQFRLMATFVAGVCVLVAVTVFVLAPRSNMTHNPLTARDAGGRAEAGFTDTVNTRTSPLATGRREPVLNIRLALHGHDVGSENRTWLLRGAALDQYNIASHNWTRSQTAQQFDHTLPLTDNHLDLAELAEETRTFEAQVTLRQIGHNALFTVLPPTHIQSSSLREVSFSPLDQQLTSSGASSAMIYSFAWPAPPPPGLASRYHQMLTDHSQRHAFTLYDEHLETFAQSYARGWRVQPERIARYTRNVLAPHGLDRDTDAHHTPDDARIATVLTEHLRNDFRYTLQNPAISAQKDPVVEFIFNHRQGHCELFASALAAMTRSIGMQSRVITGYVASEYNRIGGYYVVRQRNAHAWTEINVGPDLGWQTFDPTSPHALAAEHGVTPGWRTTLRQLYDHAEFGWIRSVVAFDQHSQQAVLQGVRQTVQHATDNETSWLGQAWAFLQSLPERWHPDGFTQAFAGLLLVSIGVGLAYLARLLMIRRQRLIALHLTALPRAKRRGLTRRLRFYLTMLDMLERHGYVRPGWQSPFSFAQELAEANPMRFDPVVALTEIFYEIRFGHRQLDADRKRRITAHLKQLEHTLARPRD